jgi:hypothetical protein
MTIKSHESEPIGVCEGVCLAQRAKKRSAMSIAPVGSSTSVQPRTPVQPKQNTEEATESVHTKNVEAQPVTQSEEAGESAQEKAIEQQDGSGKLLNILA